MSTDQLTDAQVLAELREDERAWFRSTSHGWVTQALQRLALARIEAREAAAREREACAAIIDAESTQLRADVAGDYISRARHLDALAARIRARGGAA